MKTKLFTLIMMIANIFFISFTFTACGESVDNTVEDQNVCENPYPERLEEMIKSWDETKEYSHSELEKISNDYTKCREECDKKVEGCTQEEKRTCSNTQSQEIKKLDKEYIQRINKIPLEVCGAEIMISTDHGSRGNYDKDTDGDGFSNAFEFYYKLDPCNPYSSKAQKESCTDDGALDYDNDGIPNAQDRFPDCDGDCG